MIFVKGHLIKTLQVQENYMFQLKNHYEKELDKINKRHILKLAQITNVFFEKNGLA